jgi:hypothetical protein
MKIYFLFIIMATLSINSFAQNVGIGTSNPQSKLDINGGLTVGSLYSGVNAAPANGAIIQGYVGIGTTQPVNGLHIHESDAVFPTNGEGLQITSAFFGATNTDGFTIRLSQATAETRLLNYENASLIFGTDGNDRMYLSPSGFLGIGTPTPDNYLHIFDDRGILPVIKLSTTTATQGGKLSLETSPSPKLELSNDEASAILRLKNAAGAQFDLTATGGVNTTIAAGQDFKINTDFSVDADGKTVTKDFQMTNGADLNKILRSDASGNATWVYSTTTVKAQNGVNISTTAPNATATDPYVELGGTLVRATTISKGGNNLVVDGAGRTTFEGGRINLNENSDYRVNIATGTSTGPVDVGSGASDQTINLGTGAGVKTVELGSTNTTSTTTINSGSGAVNVNAGNDQPTNINTGGSSGTVTVGGTAAQTIAIGTGAANKTVSLGSTNGGSTTTINSGSGAVNVNAGNNRATNVNTGTSTGTVTIGGTAAQTIAIGTGAANKTVSLGSTNGNSSTTINSGSGAVNVNAGNSQPTNINTGTNTAAVSIGGDANTVTLGTNNAGSNVNVPKLTASRLVSTDASSNLVSFTNGNSAQILQSNGAALPTWIDKTGILQAQNGLSVATTGGSASATNPFVELGGSLYKATTLSKGGFNLIVDGAGSTTLEGGAINLNDNSNFAVNIATGTSTGQVDVGTGASIQTINLGTGAAAKTISLGSTNGTSTTNIRSGSGAVNVNTSNNRPTNINTGTSTGTVTIGGTAAQTIAIGTGAANKTVSLGSTNGGSTTTINSGSGAVNINAGNSQATNINTGTNTAAVSIGGDANTVTLGTNNAGSNVNVPKLTASKAVFTDASKNLVSSGTLGVDQGGTGLTTLTANSVLIGNGTSSPTFVAAGASGNVLVSNGTTWISSTPLGTPIYARVTGSNFTTSSRSLTNITGLSIALEVSSVYEFEAALQVRSADADGTNYGINYSGTAPTSVDGQVSGFVDLGGNEGHAQFRRLSGNNTVPVGTSSGTTFMEENGVDGAIHIRGIIVTPAGTAGNLTVRTLQYDTGSTTVYTGSYLKVTKIQ